MSFKSIKENKTYVALGILCMAAFLFIIADYNMSGAIYADEKFTEKTESIIIPTMPAQDAQSIFADIENRASGILDIQQSALLVDYGWRKVAVGIGDSQVYDGSRWVYVAAQSWVKCGDVHSYTVGLSASDQAAIGKSCAE